MEMQQIIEKYEMGNKALTNALLERVKLIEMTGNEIQRLRAYLQKMQHQNLQLAQSNTQKLAELKLCRQQMKTLQHDLGCKNGMLKAMKLEAEPKKVTPHREIFLNTIPEAQPIRMEEEDIVDDLNGDADKDYSGFQKSKRRRQSKSSAPSNHQVQPRVNTDIKRLSVRKLSGRLKHEEIKEEEEWFQIDDDDDTQLSVHPKSDYNPVLENVEKDPFQNEAKDLMLSSLSRPSRQAAKKVQSYTEIPLNAKMLSER
ncbi:unnamed protein product [Cuscuta epithymum]|uniref:Shugoshin C-terminal domain-containing protein n=2 Tax=Cuscuta epithymum TaxID=186058 RepID=A0AAV0FKP6_9ASTE|nr:unnamed protein product [Cuscuta epithymum]